jgi:cell wall-associated NlpC family hydrolase
MPQQTRLVVAVFLSIAIAAPCARAEESLGDKIKNLFATPTPAPRKHRKASAKKPSPTPTPSATPKRKPSPSETPAPKRKSSPTPSPSPSPSPTATPTPSAKRKRNKTPTPTPSPTASETPEATASPTPNPSEATSEIPAPAPTPTPTSTPKKGAPATIRPNEIVEYDKYSPAVRKIVDLALDLTTRNLEYKYGSADPASGGMDCSGFVSYVLTQNGVRDVPRDSSQQYVWLRKAGKFEAVISHKDDTFELDALRSGDLLFWTGTYNIDRDPPITHAMIYLGHEKGTGRRIMVGASDGRTYKGESRYGVSVFDFKIARPTTTNEGRTTPTFVGYGHVPDLSPERQRQ